MTWGLCWNDLKHMQDYINMCQLVKGNNAAMTRAIKKMAKMMKASGGCSIFSRLTVDEVCDMVHDYVHLADDSKTMIEQIAALIP